jgi:hypothetical protein
MAKQKPFSDQLRDALRKSEKTRYAISKETGIAQSILARFVNHGAGLSLESVDKLCEALGGALAIKSGRKTKG